MLESVTLIGTRDLRTLYDQGSTLRKYSISPAGLVDQNFPSPNFFPSPDFFPSPEN